MFIATARSAYRTARFCYRVSRLHSRKVHRFATSPEAIATYRTLWNCIELACMFTIWLGTVASEKIDEYVQSCLKEDAIAPIEDEAKAERPIVTSLPSCGIVEDSIIPPSEIKPTVESLQQPKRKTRRTRKTA